MINKAKCKNCLDIIESKHRHDFVTCSCYTNTAECTGIFIDGGQEYLRGGGNLGNLIYLDDKGEEHPLKDRL
jgi:hypothetical protein